MSLTPENDASQAAQWEVIRESERRFAEAQRIAGIGSFSYDVATQRMLWTVELFNIYGIERNDRGGPAFEEYVARVAPADRPALRTALALALHDGTHSTVEHDIVWPSGERRRLRSHCGGIRDANGQVVRLVGTAQDITEQWALAERARRSEQRYALAVEGTTDGIWLYDPVSRTVDVSPRLLELIGQPHATAPVSVEWVCALLPGEEYETLREAVRLHRDKRVPLEVDLQLTVPGRGVRHLRLRGRVVVHDNGQDHMLAGTLSDVTEQRAMQMRLHHDSKMNALGVLAGGIAHDFNNLVTAMLGYAQLAAEETRDNASAQMHLNQVMDSARRSRTIVQEILAFSRPELSRRSVVNVERLADETVRLIQSSLPRHTTLEVHGSGAAQYVLGDKGQLQRVLVNLCNNSIYAVAEHGGRVVVTLSRCEVTESQPSSPGLAPGDYVRIDVTDNGVGIGPSTLPNVFNPFFTTKPMGDGAGLGLSIVHGIVTATGGAVLVDSVKGVGTTVSVWLPRVDAPAVPIRVAEAPSSAPPARLVVVDDDPAVGRLLQAALSRAGFSVELFASPRAALVAFASNPRLCDIIVTDFTMPEFNGIEMLERIRQLGVTIPAVMVTGYADGAPPDALKRAGVSLIVEKPVELQVLVEQVKSVLATAH